MKNKAPILYILFLIILVYGCGTTFARELLYTGAKIKVEGNVASKSDRKAIKAARRISAPNP
jgi:hypothetical protein